MQNRNRNRIRNRNRMQNRNRKQNRFSHSIRFFRFFSESSNSFDSLKPRSESNEFCPSLLEITLRTILYRITIFNIAWQYSFYIQSHLFLYSYFSILQYSFYIAMQYLFYIAGQYSAYIARQ